MNITVEISTELESKLRRAAADAGVTASAFILEVLHDRLNISEAIISHTDGPSSYEEARLIAKINTSFSAFEWGRYHQLIQRRREEKLTESEHSELVSLYDQIETANADRIKHLVELARIRKTSLDSLLES